MVEDLTTGYLQKMLVTPVSRAAILPGRLLSDATRANPPVDHHPRARLCVGFSVATGIPRDFVILFHYRLLLDSPGQESRSRSGSGPRAQRPCSESGFLTSHCWFMAHLCPHGGYAGMD